MQFFSSRYLFSHKLKGATLAFFVTLACTVLFDLSIAIVAGMALCCVIFTVKCVQHVEVTISEVDPQRLQRINLSYHPRHSSVRVVYISGAIFFGSAGYLERSLAQLPSDTTSVILSVRGVSTVDATGIQTFSRFIQAQQAHGTRVFFTGASPAFRTAMDRGGVTQLVGESAFYWSAMDALSDIAQEQQTV
ncbi:STAS domain-containing protein [Pseudoflavonifractor sp. SW1122]|uniref:STAS domain-containing protein n=1 Tax=Pseudoflavonifractor sp. SW1122 TaxID=2530044 RepID=UPI00143874CB|nr:STAS domain-containing protein [Pseudoflavonifractor sp. SW1122]